jgi:BarA-like signal transduction histidine kinase
MTLLTDSKDRGLADERLKESKARDVLLLKLSEILQPLGVPPEVQEGAHSLCANLGRHACLVKPPPSNRLVQMMASERDFGSRDRECRRNAGSLMATSRMSRYETDW